MSYGIALISTICVICFIEYLVTPQKVVLPSEDVVLEVKKVILNSKLDTETANSLFITPRSVVEGGDPVGIVLFVATMVVMLLSLNPGICVGLYSSSLNLLKSVSPVNKKTVQSVQPSVSKAIVCLDEKISSLAEKQNIFEQDLNQAKKEVQDVKTFLAKKPQASKIDCFTLINKKPPAVHDFSTTNTDNIHRLTDKDKPCVVVVEDPSLSEIFSLNEKNIDLNKDCFMKTKFSSMSPIQFLKLIELNKDAFGLQSNIVKAYANHFESSRLEEYMHINLQNSDAWRKIVSYATEFKKEDFEKAAFAKEDFRK